jgi:hypothetical protein
MPNWCNNTLELLHEDPAMLERARVAFKEGRLCNEFVPVPESLHIVAGRAGADGEPSQVLLEQQEEANLAQHGYANWYDYCVNEWGTKWDVGGDDLGPAQDIPGGLIMAFDSAWAPPIQFYEKLMDLGFSVRASYYEPGMCFAGIWEDGDDDYYDLSDMNSEQVREQLPEHLDEAYGISECMAEWEEENAEDLDETPHEFGTPGSFTIEEGLKKEDK